MKHTNILTLSGKVVYKKYMKKRGKKPFIFMALAQGDKTFQCIAFDQVAEDLEYHILVGDYIYIDGKLYPSEYNGQKKLQVLITKFVKAKQSAYHDMASKLQFSTK